jgi:uncharacterized membrane protein YoaK (UPF0700 family)
LACWDCSCSRLLLGVIVVAFVSGAIIGALLTQHASRWAMAIPSLAVLFASAFAFAQRAQHASRA